MAGTFQALRDGPVPSFSYSIASPRKTMPPLGMRLSVGRDEAMFDKGGQHLNAQTLWMEVESDLSIALDSENAVEQRGAEALPGRLLDSRSRRLPPVNLELARRV